jgi:hypothetical protein
MSNATNRYWVDYVTGNIAGVSREHSVMLRIAAGEQSVADVAAQGAAIFLSFLTAIAATSFRTGWRVIRTRVATAGNDFSLPVTPPQALSDFAGLNTGNQWNVPMEAVQYTWVGRSFTTGKRARLSLYGIQLGNTGTVDANFRFTSGEGTWVNASSQVLTAAGGLCCVDGSQAGWYPYVNVQYNSFWERAIRRSG